MIRDEAVAGASAGISATTILGEKGARATLLRTVTPLSHGLTWIGSFLGVVGGAFVFPALAPPDVRTRLIALTAITLVVAAAVLTSGRWVPERYRYRVLRIGAIAGISIGAALYVAAPTAIPVLLVISIGFPLQVSYFLHWLDLRNAMIFWTMASTLALGIALADGVPTGQIVPLYLSVVPLTWVLAVLSYQLAEARIAAIDRAAMKALRDSQTGLANRRGMIAIGNAMLAEGRVAGLVLLDLDDFKSANSLYGHAGGDRVIARVGDALLKYCGEDDLAVRLGGDEFLVVVSGSGRGSPAETESALLRLVDDLNFALEMPGIRLSATAGTAVIGGDGTSVDELMQVAESRLARAKDLRPDRSSRVQIRGRIVPIERQESAVLQDEPSDEVIGPVGLLRRSSGVLAAGLVLIASSYFLDPAYTEPYLIAAIGAALLVCFAGNRLLPAGSFSPLRQPAGVAVYALIALIAYLSGGANGPALPLLFVLIAYDSRDDSRALMLAKFLLAELVVFSTLLFSHADTALERETAYSIVLAISVMLPLILGLMLRFRGQIGSARRRVRESARRDALTGVLNRGAFESVAQAAIASGERCAIVMIDLDNFKDVNTADGYLAGDAVLSAIGQALNRATRQLDVIGRVGGDEFAALLRETRELDATDAAARFMIAVDQAVSASSSSEARRVSASCGIAMYPEHGADFATLMLAADNALMQVKHSGKSAALLQPVSAERS